MSDRSYIRDYTSNTWLSDMANSDLRVFDKAFELLVEFLEIAQLQDDFSSPVRGHGFWRHVIICNATSETIDGIRVALGRAFLTH